MKPDNANELVSGPITKQLVQFVLASSRSSASPAAQPKSTGVPTPRRVVGRGTPLIVNMLLFSINAVSEMRHGAHWRVRNSLK